MNQVIRTIPVYSEKNKQFFLDHPQYPPVTVAGFDTEVRTAPLLIDKKFNLIAISMIESELNKGTQDETMTIGDHVSMACVYLELGSNIIKVACRVNDGSIYQMRDISPVYQPLELAFQTVIYLSSQTLNTLGNPLDMPEEFKETGVFVSITVRGHIVPKMGETEMVASLKLHNMDPDEVVTGTQAFYAGAKVVAFDLNYHLDNHILKSIPVKLGESSVSDKAMNVTKEKPIFRNTQREVLIRATTEYLASLDRDQFDFLLTEVYRVPSALELIHYFSTSDEHAIESAFRNALIHDPQYKFIGHISYEYNYAEDKPRRVIMPLPVPLITCSPMWSKAGAENEIELPSSAENFRAHLRTVHGTDANLNLGYNEVIGTINGISDFSFPARWFRTDGNARINDKRTKESDPTIRVFKTHPCNPFAIRQEERHAVLMTVHTDGFRDLPLSEWNSTTERHLLNIKEHILKVCTGLRLVDMFADKVYLESENAKCNFAEVLNELKRVEFLRLDESTVSVSGPSEIYYSKTNNLMPFAVRKKGLDGRVALMLSNAKGWYDLNHASPLKGGASRDALESYLRHGCGLRCYTLASSDLVHVDGEYDDIVKALKVAEEAFSK